jgi:hypothetical protein
MAEPIIIVNAADLKTAENPSTSMYGLITDPISGKSYKILYSKIREILGVDTLQGGIANAKLATVPEPNIKAYFLFGGAGAYNGFPASSSTFLSVSAPEASAKIFIAVKYSGDTYWTRIEMPGIDISTKVDLSVFQPVKDKTDIIQENSNSDWALPVVDSNGRLLGGFKIDGSFQVAKWGSHNSIPGSILNDSEIGLSKLMSEVKDFMWQSLDPGSGYVCAILDANNRKLFAIRTDGVAEICGINITDLKQRLTNVESVVPLILYIRFWGDSLTAGAGGGGTTIVSVLQSLVGSKYTAVNHGVGGEDVNTITARQGGVPVFTQGAFTLPADGSTVPVFTTTDLGVKNKYGKQITPLLQGDGSSINPCWINGIECTLSIVSNQYYLKRNVLAAVHTNISAGSMLVLNGAKQKNAHTNVYWMGQNVGYTNEAQLVSYYKDMISYNQNSNYIIIGLHSGTAASRQVLETLMENEFGLHFFNWRKYVVAYGLEDAGITATSGDNAAIAAGSIPPSLLFDSVHLTAVGYTVLGNALFKYGKTIGLFN